MITIAGARNGLNFKSILLFTLMLYAATSAIMFSTYISIGNLNVQLGILSLLAVAGVDKESKSLRCLYPCILFSLADLFIPVKFFAFAALVSGIGLLIESYTGILNRISYFILVFISPLVEYACNVFTFPIRLGLTSVAATCMKLGGLDVIAAGNVISTKGMDFSVDAECMGLKMLSTSLLSGLILAGLLEKQARKQLGYFAIFILTTSVVLLNMASNIIRIIILVHFQVAATSPMHSFIGVICFIIYIIIPCYFLVKRLVKIAPVKPVAAVKIGGFITGKPLWMLNIAVSVLVLFINFRLVYHQTSPLTIAKKTIYGYKVDALDNNITKLNNSTVLAYIKPIAGCYATDHHPMICWRGSGFNFEKVDLVNVEGYQFYTAILVKNHEKLYTAWWYDNGTRSCVGQLSWRWDVFKGAGNYAIANITCETREALIENVISFRNRKIIQQVLQ